MKSGDVDKIIPQLNTLNNVLARLFRYEDHALIVGLFRDAFQREMYYTKFGVSKHVIHNYD